MRTVLVFCLLLASRPILFPQELAPTLKLSVGTSKSAVVATFGKRFGPFSVASGDDNAAIGVPIGTYDVYHLTAPPDRLYVTIVHFAVPSGILDALMLEPADKVTVSQVLKDQPALASVCKAKCDVVVVRNRAGNRSLLLRPKSPNNKTVLFFDGDGATITWKSITSTESVVSWVYVLSRSDFEEHRLSKDEQMIGEWSPGS